MDTETNILFEQDQQAVQAVRGGDAERYRELVERHERRVYAVAWSRLGDAALAEEVAQEAFIRAYRRLWLLGDGAKFSGWIAAITRRVAINCGMRNRRELNKRARWALEQTTAPADEPTELCPPETLREALAGLPAAHRECLVLFYLEGKSGAEAAEALGISETALRVRLHRARAALRERLEEKLEGSLAKLRPAKTLVPAVMAGVLASSSAKAASAGGMGATVAAALAKIGFSKWLLPFMSFFSYLVILPALGITWLFNRMELKNFREQKGFRAQLFRQASRWLLPWCALMLVGMCILMQILSHPGNWRPVCFIVAGAGLLMLPSQIRLVSINRSRFSIAIFVCSSASFLLFLLAGLALLPMGWFIIPALLLPLVMARYQTDVPMTMDYNLFLRGAEGLLKIDGAVIPDNQDHGAYGRENLLAFARFLGTRWLARSCRWTEEGLELGLIPVNVSPWGLLRSYPTWSRGSRLLLQHDGKATAKLGEKDRQALQRMQGQKLPSVSELEELVSRAVGLAWRQFQTGDLPAAERAIGQTPEAEVFIKPRAKTARTRMQRGIMIGCVLFAAGALLLTRFYMRHFPVLSLEGLSQRNYQRAMSDLTTAKTEEQRFYALDSAAKESFVAGKFDDAQNYAQELMALLPEYEGRGNYGNAIHDANLVLGRIAVREGRIEAAKSYLIAAGKSPGSPNLDSFGPNMTLAKDLLEKGERDAVLEYFQLCRAFWKMGGEKLDQWNKEVMRGKIPNFGANLLY